MKKTSPLKLIRIFAAVMLFLLAVEFFMDEKFKTPLMVLRLITAVTLFVYAMFNSTAIEQEKIEKERAKAN
jgi:hypothetical protein